MDQPRATPEQMDDSITGTSDDQRFAGTADALKKALQEMDAASGPATDDDLLQIQMFIAASASGKFAEWPLLRRASGRVLAELRTLRTQLAQQDAAVEALLRPTASNPLFLGGVALAGIPPNQFHQTGPQPSPTPDAGSSNSTEAPEPLISQSVIKGSDDSRRLDNWRPIATAPKKPEGLIDIWCSSPDGVNQWREAGCWWNPARKCWFNARGAWDCATHWMPAPKRPIDAAMQEPQEQA